MTLWFTADLHLGHTNIIRYCNRPFADVASMNRALIDGWNATVGAGDDAWVLGDFALGTIADTLPLVADLHGRKILVAGNHDRCWTPNRGSAAWVERYLEAGFEEVLQGPVALQIGSQMGGRTVAVSHFPYRGDSQEEDRFTDYRPVDRGEWLLHGHVHDRWRRRDRMINVGVDVWSFRPVSEAILSELLVDPEDS